MEDNLIKTLIVDNNRLISFAISEILRATEYHDVIGIAHSNDEALEMIENHDVKLMFVNVNLIYNNSLESIINAINAQNRNLKVIAVFSDNVNHYLNDMLDVYVDGVIDYTHDVESITLVSRLVMDGFQCIPKSKRNSYLDKKSIKLTQREKEVFNFIAQGLSNKHIAEKLDISFKTVSVHRYNILYKLGIKNTSDLLYHINKVTS